MPVAFRAGSIASALHFRCGRDSRGRRGLSMGNPKRRPETRKHLLCTKPKFLHCADTKVQNLDTEIPLH